MKLGEWQQMGRWGSVAIFELALWLTVLVVLTVVGGWIVQRFRDDADESETNTELLSKFQEMRQQGYLREEEFRKLSTHLGMKLPADLKRDKQGG